MINPYLFKLSNKSVGSQHRLFKMVRLYLLYNYIACNACWRKKTKERYALASKSMETLLRKHIGKHYEGYTHWWLEILGSKHANDLQTNNNLRYLITLEKND